MKTVYDFWVFNKESIVLACVIAAPSGLIFAAFHELGKYLVRKLLR